MTEWWMNSQAILVKERLADFYFSFYVQAKDVSFIMHKLYD